MVGTGTVVGLVGSVDLTVVVVLLVPFDDEDVRDRDVLELLERRRWLVV